jgi:hypothetical protein
VPFYDEHGIRLSRVLTDRGTEFCGTQSHEYELYLAVEDIDHSRTKTKSPQTTDVIDKNLFKGCRGFGSPVSFSVRQRRAVSPSRPAHIGASRAGVVKTDRRSPPQAAWS